MAEETCFGDIIGITPIDCECTEDGRPENYADSSSGLYLSALVPLPYLAASKSCDYGDMWVIAETAINEGKTLTKQDILQGLSKMLNPLLKPYRGTIGDTSKLDVTDKPVTKPVIFQKMYFRNIRKGKVTITRVGLHMNTTQNYSVSFYDTNGVAIGAPTVVAGVANKLIYTALATPLVVDMSDVNNRIIYCAFDRLGAKPKVDKYHCGCSGVQLRYNEENPTWNSKGEHQWGSYLMAAAGEADDFSDMLNLSKISDKFNYGIFLDMISSCDVDICPAPAVNYSTDPLSMAIALMVQHYSAIAAFRTIKTANKIDTLLSGLSPEGVDVTIQAYNVKLLELKEYVVNYFANNIEGYTDCYYCNNPTGYRVGPINI